MLGSLLQVVHLDPIESQSLLNFRILSFRSNGYLEVDTSQVKLLDLIHVEKCIISPPVFRDPIEYAVPLLI